MKRSFAGLWFVFVAAMLALAGCAGDGRQETAGEFIDDSVITAKVKAAFVENREVSALNIGVHTNKGVVQLSGFAKDAHESWKAADLARNVRGVKAVRNDITVK